MVLVFPLLLLSLPPGYRGGITGTLDRAGFVYVRLVPTVRAVAYVAGLPAFLLELRIQSTWKTCYGRKVQHTVDLGSRGSRRTQRKQEVLREVETFPPREVTHDSPPGDGQQRPPPSRWRRLLRFRIWRKEARTAKWDTPEFHTKQHDLLLVQFPRRQHRHTSVHGKLDPQTLSGSCYPTMSRWLDHRTLASKTGFCNVDPHSISSTKVFDIPAHI